MESKGFLEMKKRLTEWFQAESNQGNKPLLVGVNGKAGISGVGEPYENTPLYVDMRVFPGGYKGFSLLKSIEDKDNYEKISISSDDLRKYLKDIVAASLEAHENITILAEKIANKLNSEYRIPKNRSIGEHAHLRIFLLTNDVWNEWYILGDDKGHCAFQPTTNAKYGALIVLS